MINDWATHSDPQTVINYLIRCLMNPLPSSIENIDKLLLQKSQRITFRALYFLLDQKASDNIHEFTIYTLPRLLEQLHHTTIRESVEYQGKVRGRVVWPATYKARFTQDYNPNLYHCCQAQSYFNTPENQLLKYLLEQINHCLKLIPSCLRNGFYFIPDGEEKNLFSNLSQLQIIETKIQSALKNVYLRQVDLLSHIQALHLRKAENSRLEDYAQVAQLYQTYDQLINQKTWHPFHSEGQHFLLLPNQVTEETKIWIKVAAILIKNYHLTQGENRP